MARKSRLRPPGKPGGFGFWPRTWVMESEEVLCAAALWPDLPPVLLVPGPPLAYIPVE